MRVLDLFCGAGGAAVGIQRALPHAQIIGVDIIPQPRYPFAFVQADATRPPFDLRDFDFIWASPPCHAHVALRHVVAARFGGYPHTYSAIAQVRESLTSVSTPWVIENVPGAPLRYTIVLNGLMFGLNLERPRMFESNVLLLAPTRPRSRNFVSVLGNRPDGRRLPARADGTAPRVARGLEEAQDAMGIDWMEWHELKNAVPPAYSEFITRQIFGG